MAELASGYKEREVLNFYSRENGTYMYPYLEFPPTLAKYLNLWQLHFIQVTHQNQLQQVETVFYSSVLKQGY